LVISLLVSGVTNGQENKYKRDPSTTLGGMTNDELTQSIITTNPQRFVRPTSNQEDNKILKILLAPRYVSQLEWGLMKYNLRQSFVHQDNLWFVRPAYLSYKGNYPRRIPYSTDRKTSRVSFSEGLVKD